MNRKSPQIHCIDVWNYLLILDSEKLLGTEFYHAKRELGLTNLRLYLAHPSCTLGALQGDVDLLTMRDNFVRFALAWGESEFSLSST